MDCLSSLEDNVMLKTGAVDGDRHDGEDDVGHGEKCDAGEVRERNGTGRKEGERERKGEEEAG